MRPFKKNQNLIIFINSGDIALCISWWDTLYIGIVKIKKINAFIHILSLQYSFVRVLKRVQLITIY